MLDVDRRTVRAAVFNHLAGIAVAPTVSALWERGALELLAEAPGPVAFDDLVSRTHANRGYLRVALRLLMSCGWMRSHAGDEGFGSYVLTREGRLALMLVPPLYSDVVSVFLPKALLLDEYLFGTSDEPVRELLGELVQRSKERWRIAPHTDPVTEAVRDRVRRHLDGLLVGPAMVALARRGVFGRLAQGAVDLRSIEGNHASLVSIVDLLAAQDWVLREGETVQLTGRGRYAAQIAAAYGVTVSYLPLFTALSTLIFGNARIPRVDANGFETLVNRSMNVWGSGGAHKTYFGEVEELIVELFNQPLPLQPHGICDMGCGDGTLLVHLFEVVKQRTARGGVLDRHPLILVGADINKVARRVTKQTLHKAGIPVFNVIYGDINRPAQLASELEQLGHDIHDLLHIRSFLDHNRPYLRLANYVPGTRRAKSTGAFAYLGDEIAAEELEENLVRHLRRWAPYIGRFGLIVLELHTLPPDVTAGNLDLTPAVAYDGTHGYSDQYLVELPVFLECAREAGLQADARFQRQFPPSELATVSVNFFTLAHGGAPASGTLARQYALG